MFTICNINAVRKIPLYLERFISSFHLLFVLVTCKKNRIKILLIILHYLQFIPRNSVIYENKKEEVIGGDAEATLLFIFSVGCLVLCYISISSDSFSVAHFKDLITKHTAEHRQSVALETQNTSWIVM
jgi:hypothetical protein